LTVLAYKGHISTADACQVSKCNSYIAVPFNALPSQVQCYSDRSFTACFRTQKSSYRNAFKS